MKKINLVCTGGGLLLLLASFLPFASIMGKTIKVNEFDGAAGKFMWVMALAVIAVGALNKRWLHIASLICAALALLVGFKWMSDVNKFGGGMGVGGWLLLAGAGAAVLGSVMGLIKKQYVPAA